MITFVGGFFQPLKCFFVPISVLFTIPHFTIHSLRHANASAMLKLNIPDKYAMERMGHSTPNMLKQVYQHIFRDEQTKVANKMNDYFNDILK